MSRWPRQRPAANSYQWLTWCVAWFVLLAASLLVAGARPPHVNEAHYLTKARHYYDSDFGAGDLFLESRDAHALFFATLGRATEYWGLEQAAWIGRLVIWSALAAGMLWLFATIGLSGSSALAAGLSMIALQKLTPMAGEWIVGGVEGKGFAFVLSLVSLTCCARGKWEWGLVAAGASAAWHVLIGGWWMLLVAASLIVEERWSAVGRRRYWSAGFAAAALAMIGLLPALRLNRGVPSAVAAEAASIYVYQRLSHHLLFQRFPPQAIAGHFLGWGIFWTLWFPLRNDPMVRRVGRLVWGAGVVMVLGIAISLWSEWAPPASARLARYYWFRTSDWLLPLGLVVVAARHAVVRRLQNGPAVTGPRGAWPLVAACLLFLAAFPGPLLDEQWRRLPPACRQSGLFRGDPRSDWDEVLAEWQAACRWARDHSPAGAVWLTPRHQQTFKWYSGRAEVVNWKDVPQDAPSLVQWWRRYQRVYPREVVRYGLTAHGPQHLRRLADEYGARWVLIDRRRSRAALPWKRRYPERLTESTRFVIYELAENDGHE